MLPSLLSQGILLGLGAAVPIGPVNVEIARRNLRGGFLAGFVLGGGAVTVDCVYAVVSGLGLGHLSGRPMFYWPFVIGGAALFGFLGTMSLRQAWQATQRDLIASTTTPLPSLHGGYVTGLLMTLVNPMTLAFWFVSLPGLLGKQSARSPHDLPMLCLGVCAGAAAWVIFFNSLLALAGRWRRPWWTAAADAIGGTILLGFAAHLLAAAFAQS